MPSYTGFLNQSVRYIDDEARTSSHPLIRSSAGPVQYPVYLQYGHSWPVMLKNATRINSQVIRFIGHLSINIHCAPSRCSRLFLCLAFLSDSPQWNVTFRKEKTFNKSIYMKKSHQTGQIKYIAVAKKVKCRQESYKSWIMAAMGIG